MIFVLERITAILLMAVLIFNLTQRRRTGGEQKRYASLFLSLPFLMFFLGILIVKRFRLGPWFLLPAFAAGFLVFVALSRRILIFRRRCPRCGAAYPVKDVFYTDSPVCGSCVRREPPGLPESPADLPGGSPEADLPEQTVPGVPSSFSPEKIDWAAWKPAERAVIVYIVDRPRNRVLLIHKKTGLGKGKVNAPGGRLEPDETSLQAAVRECREEVGLILDPETLEKRMELHFQFTSGYALYGEAFFTDTWSGEPMETGEADPFWCDLDKLPLEKMWEDDAHWLPDALAGKKRRGFYVFDDDKMLFQKLEDPEDW